MRIRFETEGGLAHFPGLAGPFEIDTGALPPDRGRALVEAVERCGIATGAAAPAAAKTRPDARTYRITIVTDGRDHVVTLTDPIADPAFAALVSLLRQEQRHRP